MGDTRWTILRVVEWTTQYFQKHGIDNPRLNAEVLLAYSLKTDRIHLYLNYDKPLTGEELKEYRKLITRRANREPLQYIIGSQEFRSLHFKVTKGVFIPRPETEILVEEALRTFLCAEHRDNTINILDLATGSGIVAIILAKELLNASIIATDISDVALKIAKENARVHEVEKCITFLKGDLFYPIKGDSEHFNLVISNPPYIPTGDFPDLQAEVRDFEPRIALDGGKEGLSFYRRILSGVTQFLLKNSWLMVEVGDCQAHKVAEIIEATGKFHSPLILKDLSGIERVIKAQRNG